MQYYIKAIQHRWVGYGNEAIADDIAIVNGTALYRYMFNNKLFVDK